MPNSFNEILRKYSGYRGEPTAAEIAEANKPKTQIDRMPTREDGYLRAAGIDGNRGTLNEDEMQRDIRTMDFGDLARKYGLRQAAQLAEIQVASQNDYLEDKYAQDTRSSVQTGKDRAIGVVEGGLNTLMSGVTLGGMGLDLAAGAVGIDTDFGVSLAKEQQEIQERNREFYSDPTKLGKRATDARFAAAKIDSDVRYKNDVKEVGKFRASLRQIGRDAADASEIYSSMPTGVEEVVTQAIGSLGGSAALMKLAQKGALKTVDVLGRQGIISAAANVKKLDRLGQIVAGGVVIGTTEVGGAYSQSVNEVMALSHEELVNSSADYRALLAQGVDPAKAKIMVAESAGKITAALTAPLALAGGGITSKFLSNPFKSSRFADAVSNIAQETTEETLQGANSSVASNVAISETADVNRSYGQDVGRSAVEGAIGGVGSSASMQAPGVAARGAATAARGTYEGVRDGMVMPAINALRERGARIENELAQNGGASGYLKNKVGQAANQFADYLENNPDGLEEGQLNTVMELVDAVDFSRDEVKDVASKNLYRKLRKAETIEDAYDIVAKQISGTNNDAEIDSAWKVLEHLNTRKERLEKLSAEVNTFKPVVEGDVDTSLDAQAADAALPGLGGEGQGDRDIFVKPTAPEVGKSPSILRREDSERFSAEAQAATPAAPKEVSAAPTFAQSISRAVSESPVINAAAEKSKQGMAKVVRKIGAISADEVATPEGQAKVKAVIDAVEFNPGDVNPEAIGTILEHNEAGRINLSPEQKNSLSAVSAMVQARRAFLEEKEAAGLADATDLVRKQVITDKGNEKQPSIAERVGNLNRAYRSGDIERAKKELTGLRNLAQHFQNKLAAINEHHVNGDGTEATVPKFQGLTTAGKFVPMKSQWINAQVPASVRTAKAIAAEAKLIGNVLNEMTKVFADLGVEGVELTQLHPDLTPDLREVVKAARAKRKAGNEAARQNEKPGKASADGGSNSNTSTPASEGRPAAVDDGGAATSGEQGGGKAEREEAAEDKARASELDAASIEHASALGQEDARRGFRGNAPKQFTQDQAIAWFNAYQAELKALEKEREQEAAPEPEVKAPKVDPITAEKLKMKAQSLLTKANDNEDVGSPLGGLDNMYSKLQERMALRQRVEKTQKAYDDNPNALTYKALEVAVERLEAFDDSYLEQTKAFVKAMEEEAKAEARKEAETEENESRAIEEEMLADRVREAENAQDPEDGFLPEPEVDQVEENDFFNEVQEAEQESDADAAGDSDLRNIFPRLLGAAAGSSFVSYFLKAFRKPKNLKSRLLEGVQSPMQVVYDALSGRAAFDSLTGDKQGTAALSPEVIESYQDYLETEGEMLRNALNRRLNKFKEFIKGKKTKNGESALLVFNQYPNGRVMNILEETPDGARFNQQLLEGAMLAGLNWLLTSNRYKQDFDTEEVIKLFGGDPEGYSELDLTLKNKVEELQWSLKGGTLLVPTVRALGESIMRYWGVEARNDASIAQAEGIAEAVGKQVLRAFQDMGYVNLHDPAGEVLAETKGLTGLKTPYVIQVTFGKESPEALRDFLEEEPRFQHPDLIERVALIEPERVDHIGTPPPKVADTQHNNRMVKNTAIQKKALGSRQNNAFKANLPFFNLIMGVTDKGVEKMFAGGLLPQDPAERARLYNGRDLATREGRNTTFGSAFRSMQRVWAGIQAEAEASGKSPEEVEVFYEYNFNRMNRMQMMGLDNPQASKLMREFMLATWSTIDLNNKKGKGYQAFMLAVGQHLGIKTHKESLKDIVKKTEAKLQDVSGSVQILQEWLKTGGEADNLPEGIVDQLINDLGERMEPAAVHSLMEYARYLNTGQNSNERKNFRTALYLEADGVTNGPMNALMLHFISDFTPEWLENARRGGLFIGNQPMSLNDFVATGSYQDLYEKSTQGLKSALANLKANLPYFMQDHNEQIGILLEMFYGKDVSFNPDTNSLEFGRGIAKNPLTVTVYGSGARGIANKITQHLLTEIGIAMTRVAQAPEGVSPAQAIFGDVSDADAKYAKLVNALNALTTDKAVYSRKQGYLLLPPSAQKLNPREQAKLEQGISPDDITPETAALFDIAGTALDNFETNFTTLFAEQMQEAIRDTMGEVLMGDGERQGTMGDIRSATQVTSIVLGHEFKKRVEDKVKWKEANVEGYNRRDFLSQNELNEIWQSLAPLAPIIEGKEQNFYFAGSERSDLGEEFSKTLPDADATVGLFKTPGFVQAPDNAGTRGMPGLVIGPGDGMMMTIYAALFGAEGTLDVYDGMNMPIDRIEEISTNVNQAVFQSWQKNPMRDLSRNYDQFIANLDMSKLSDKAVEDLKKVFYKPSERPGIGRQDIIRKMRLMQSRLQDHADWIEARHNVLSRMPQSVDQMASGMSPYVHQGTIELPEEGASDEAMLLIMNTELHDEYDRIRAERLEKTKEIRAGVPAEVARLGTKTREGHYIIRKRQLVELANKLGANEWQKKLLKQLIDPVQVKGYEVVAGSRSQLVAYAIANGLPAKVATDLANAEKSPNGVTVPGSGVIMLVNPSSEMIVHELVHAATIDIVTRFYAGEDLGPQRSVIAGSVKRLEGLMDQFLSLDTSKMDSDTATAYRNARAAIISRQNEGQMANALNEFMAWSLTNAKLGETLSKTKASPLVLLARKAYDYIKKLIWNDTRVSPVLDDMLTNIRFNTHVLTYAQIPDQTVELFDETTLYHSEAYGTNERLKDLNTLFAETVVRQLTAKSRIPIPERAKQSAKAKLEIAVNKVAKMQAATAYVFDMTPQERTTYNVVMAAMATSAELDPNSMSRIAEMYDHVAKTVNINDFLDNPESTDPNELEQARLKRDALVGRGDYYVDDLGRSSLVPNFVALSLVSEDFRKVLAKLAMPEFAKNEDGTVDAWLENAGTGVLRSFGNLTSGQGSNNENVGEAMENLLGQVIETAKDRKSLYQTYVTPVGTLSDKANNAVTGAVQKAAEYTFTKAGRIKAKSNSRIVKTAAGATRVLAAVFDNRVAGEVANGIVGAVNKSKLPTFLREGLVDVIGRTRSNANIYDLIKKVHNWVQQRRQQYREELPKILADKFTRELTDSEIKSLFRGAGKTDLMALDGPMKMDQIIELISDFGNVTARIQQKEQDIAAVSGAAWPLLQAKSKQLANWMNTGVAGSNLLRNKNAVAHLLNVRGVPEGYAPREDMVDQIDELVTLYALEGLTANQKEDLQRLATEQAEGLSFAFATMKGLRKAELDRVDDRTFFNYYKGHIGTEAAEKGTMKVVTDSKAGGLLKAGYIRVADYEGSSLLRKGGMKPGKQGYYYIPVTERAPYKQGIMQTVQHTVSGVDKITGATHGRTTVNRITDPALVKRLSKMMDREKGKEPLLPIYNRQGDVVAFERSVDPAVMARIPLQESFLESLGMWAGRLVEENEAGQVNFLLLSEMKKMQELDFNRSIANRKEYVNLFDKKTLAKDPVLADIMRSLPGVVKQQIEQVFGDEFWVRRDMLNDAMGYRKASVRDLWTGNSRLPKDVRDAVRLSLVGIFGKDTYRYMINAEEFVQNVVTDAKVLIVVKSVIVPAGNLAANVLQLWARGVPANKIASGLTRKTSEVDDYLQSRDELIRLEAELAAVADKPVRAQQLEARIQVIQDRHRRLSIWPLINAGEFTSISDATVDHEDMAFSKGRLSSFFEQQVDKLPKSAQTLARYGLVSRDTALFKGLQRSIEYGDFLAKAVLYDELTKAKGMTEAEALAVITEEFVNYDRLPGRSRGYLEDMGILWFWHFKMRSMKVAVSMLRNNPVHVAMAMMVPTPDLLGTVGSPIEDNLVNVWWENRLGYSIGPEMAWRSLFLNPWVNLTT